MLFEATTWTPEQRKILNRLFYESYGGDEEWNRLWKENTKDTFIPLLFERKEES